MVDVWECFSISWRQSCEKELGLHNLDSFIDNQLTKAESKTETKQPGKCLFYNLRLTTRKCAKFLAPRESNDTKKGPTYIHNFPNLP